MPRPHHLPLRSLPTFTLFYYLDLHPSSSAALVLSVGYVTFQLYRSYSRSYEESRLPLQRLIGEEERPAAGGGLWGGGGGVGGGGGSSERAKSSEGLLGLRVGVAPLLPEYYFILIFSCVVFMFQTLGWVTPGDSWMYAALSYCVFTSCLFLDSFLLFHLHRRPGVTVKASVVMSLGMSFAVLGAINLLPGPMPDTKCA